MFWEFHDYYIGSPWNRVWFENFKTDLGVMSNMVKNGSKQLMFGSETQHLIFIILIGKELCDV